MEDIKSRSSIIYMLHELVSRLETKTLDADDLGLLRKAHAFIDEFAASPLTYGLPSWVEREVCPACGGEFYSAALNPKKRLRLAPEPVCFADTKNVFFLDSVYVEFDGMKVRAMPGKMGTRWVMHEMICNKKREEVDPFLHPLWDETYREIDYSESVRELMKAAQ